ncbi:unnamed protein product [Camellia sinensis]
MLVDRSQICVVEVGEERETESVWRRLELRDRLSGYLNTPLIVVTSGMSKWQDMYSRVLMVRASVERRESDDLVSDNDGRESDGLVSDNDGEGWNGSGFVGDKEREIEDRQ